MPRISLLREFCTTCKAFTLHDTTAIEVDGIVGLPCRNCGKTEVHCNYALATAEQIAEQQKRYLASKANRFNLFTWAMTGTLLPNLFSEVGTNVSIQESDAGYEKQQKSKMEKEKAERAAQIKELVRFKGLGRNDTCLCGSNHKYKRCCLPKHKNFQDYGNVHLMDAVEARYPSEPAPVAATQEKGALNGRCNLSSCTSGAPATYYNHGSMAYYCQSCAMRLNRDEHNHKWAHEKFGHDLCTPKV